MASSDEKRLTCTSEDSRRRVTARKIDGQSASKEMHRSNLLLVITPLHPALPKLIS